MQGSPKYVALDVHQATTVAAVRAANGRVIARAVLPTEGSAEPELIGIGYPLLGSASCEANRFI